MAILVDIVQHTDIPAHKLKAIINIIDQHPPQPKFIFDLALWAAQYYQHPIGDALLQSLPIHLRKGEPCERVHEYLLHAIEDTEQSLSTRAKKQLATYNMVKQHQSGISIDAP